MKNQISYTLILLFFLFCSNVFADGYYQINDISVYKKSTDSDIARKEAFKTVQIDGFQQLLSKLSVNSDNTALITEEEILSTIKSMQVKKEKITPKSYSAIISIKFDKNFVAYLLNKYDIHIFSEKMNMYLIIPMLKENNLQYTFEPENRWIKPFTEEIENSNNIRLIKFKKHSFNDVLNTDLKEKKLSDFKSLIKDYSVNNILVLDAIFDTQTMILDLYTYIYKGTQLIKSHSKYKINKDLIDDAFTIATQKIIDYINYCKNFIYI